MGIISFPLMVICGALQKRVRLKTLIIIGLVLLIPGTLLLPFGDRKSRYWSIVFPAEFIGSAGATMVFANTNIGMFKFTPPHMAGTVGAAFNSALQLGAAIGLAVVTSIETNVANKNGGFTSYKGRAAGFWFLLAVVVVELIAALIFLKEDKVSKPEAAAEEVGTPPADELSSTKEKRSSVQA
jgi:MFS family permease